MGAVYEAEHLEHNRRVALKTLHHGLATEEDRERFVHEGRVAAAISHPNSVFMYGAEEIDGVPIISMELLHGGTLKDRVSRDGPMDTAAAVDAALQVIAGLEALHSAGVLHRDIKPANCFIGEDGRVRIGDFGLAVPSGPHRDTATGLFEGTPYFASPEQIRGRSLTVESDIYSLGATLFYLLSGRPPFSGRDAAAVLSRARSEPAPSLQPLVPSVPAGLSRVIGSCLAKNPSDRPQSYALLAHRLQVFAGAGHGAEKTLGLRFGATVVDLVAVVLILSPWTAGLSPARVGDLSTAVLIAYLAASEGLWSASLGKFVVGLRVTTRSQRRPGIGRALARATVLFGTLPALAHLAPGAYRSASAMLLGLEEPLFLALLFGSARRRTGYRALYELATGTRVVRTRPLWRAPAPKFSESASTAAAVLAAPATFDVYEVRAELGPTDCGTLFEAFDPRLNRGVWLHLMAPGAPAMDEGTKQSTQPTRLRWLGGARTASEAWDAFEAPGGMSVVALQSSIDRWSHLNSWLSDLLTELESGRDVPALSELWIGADGRLRVLPFPAPGVAAERPVGSWPLLLAELIRVALAAPTGHYPRGQAPPPMAGRTLIARLTSGEIHTFAAARQEIEKLSRTPAAISSRRRAASLVVGTVTTLAAYLGGLFAAGAAKITSLGEVPRLRVHVEDESTVFWVVGIVVASCGVALGSALRGAVAFHVTRVAVVGEDGAEVSRARAGVRSLIGWSPLILGLAILATRYAASAIESNDARSVLTVGLVMYGIATLASIFRPSRSPQDVAAGTWLVPR